MVQRTKRAHAAALLKVRCSLQVDLSPHPFGPPLRSSARGLVVGVGCCVPHPCEIHQRPAALPSMDRRYNYAPLDSHLYLHGGVNGTPSPNGGVPTLIGALGLDTDGFAGFDISGASGIAYATLTQPGSFASALYGINLGTGAATLIGQTGLLLRGVSVAPVPVPAPALLLGSGLLAMLVRARRRAVA